MPLDEAGHLVGQRQCADPAVLGGDSLGAQQVACLGHGEMRAAVGNQPDLGGEIALDDRAQGPSCVPFRA